MSENEEKKKPETTPQCISFLEKNYYTQTRSNPVELQTHYVGRHPNRDMYYGASSFTCLSKEHKEDMLIAHSSLQVRSERRVVGQVRVRVWV